MSRSSSGASSMREAIDGGSPCRSSIASGVRLQFDAGPLGTAPRGRGCSRLDDGGGMGSHGDEFGSTSKMLSWPKLHPRSPLGGRPRAEAECGGWRRSRAGSESGWHGWAARSTNWGSSIANVCESGASLPSIADVLFAALVAADVIECLRWARPGCTGLD